MRPLLVLAVVGLLAAPLAGGTFRETGRFPVEGTTAGKPQLWCFWAFDETPLYEDEMLCDLNETVGWATEIRVRVVGDAGVDVKLDKWVESRGRLVREQVATLSCEASSAGERRTCVAPLPGFGVTGAIRMLAKARSVSPPAILEVELSFQDGTPVP
ncbi:MAG TPA: hypothetical protein VHH36_05530 [Candidatus Thermoplasmatota archaeon]|nr:hypothetical protein [Candidatus Thermoplasmatota archaeon]